MSGNNLEITFSNGLSCVLSKPTKAILAIAMQRAKTDKFAIGATFLEKCWVSGDEAIKQDDGCIISLLEFIDDLCEVKQLEIEQKGDETFIVFDDDLSLTIAKPNRAILNEAMNKAAKSPLGFVEHIVMHCVSDDKAKAKVLADVGYLVPLLGVADALMQKKTVSLRRV
jgi:hypothetical protein